MALILILSGNFFVLIICLIGAQTCYFKRNWKWFYLSLLCVLISAGCIGAEMYQAWGPGAAAEQSVVVRSPTTPL
jgi:glucan phosphoethanolaminetransferase (alkaline phosphatase superfamily)